MTSIDLLPPVLDLARVATGGFFVISGYHKLFNRDRHAALVATLKDCGLPCKAIPFLQWWVPGWELAGGLMVVSGFAPAVVLGASALIVICLIACVTDGRKRIAAFQPIDVADKLDDILYLPEFLYILLLSLAAAEAITSLL